MSCTATLTDQDGRQWYCTAEHAAQPSCWYPLGGHRWEPRSEVKDPASTLDSAEANERNLAQRNHARVVVDDQTGAITWCPSCWPLNGKHDERCRLPVCIAGGKVGRSCETHGLPLYPSGKCNASLTQATEARSAILLEDAQQGCAKLIVSQVRVMFALGLRSEETWNEEAMLEAIADLKKARATTEQLNAVDTLAELRKIVRVLHNDSFQSDDEELWDRLETLLGPDE